MTHLKLHSTNENGVQSSLWMEGEMGDIFLRCIWSNVSYYWGGGRVENHIRLVLDSF